MIDPLNSWLEEQWAMPAEEFSVECEGARIACRGWGLSATDRPGIVLVHGFRAHAHWWDHIAPALTDGFRVAALDLSGMGDSDYRPAYHRAQHGREIAAVAEACGFDRPIVVAHSYGGIVAMTHALAQPEAFRRLTVIDSKLPAVEDDWREVRQAPQRFYPDRASALARFRLIPPGKWPVAAIADYIARHSVRETDQGCSWKFDPQGIISLNREMRRGEELENIRTPADFLYGAQSEIVTPERLAELARVLPTVRGAIAIPLSHHHVMIEQPIALVATLRALLADETAR